MSNDIPLSYNHILIDANNLFYRNHEELSHMTQQVGSSVMVTGGIYGSMRSVWRLEREYLNNREGSRVFLLFDNAKSKENMRKIVDPSYKLNRTPKPPAFYRALDYFRYSMLNSGSQYTAVYGTGYEADDIAPVIINTLPPEDPVLVVSEDLDWSRLIGWRGRTVNQLMKKQVWDKRKFNSVYNFEPTAARIMLYKAIRGDSVDNIPVGVKNVREKDVINLVTRYEDVHEMIGAIPYVNFLTDNTKKKFLEAASRLKLNAQLVSFIPLEYGDIGNCVFEGKFVPRILDLVYRSLGFDVGKFDPRVIEHIRRNDDGRVGDDYFVQPRRDRHV